MAKKSSKSKTPTQSPLTIILGALAMVIAAIVFATTGVDLTGGTLSNTSATVVQATVAPNTTKPTATTAPATTVATTAPSTGNVQTIANLTNALGYKKDFWRVYFTVPVGSNDKSKWKGGVEDELAAAIGQAQRTLDIVAYEWESHVMTDAVLAALQRGVKIRMVVDDEHGLNNVDTTLGEIEAAGIPIVNDNRSGFMHNKFIIIDGLTVWTGSMNYQPNDLFRNNNNVIMLRSKQAADTYLAEFEEMFTQKKFGKTSPKTNTANYTQDGTSIQILFSGENDVIPTMINEINNAKTQIRFMSFSFTDFDLAKAMLDRSAAGVGVSGVFETTGSLTEASELKTLYCAGIPVFQDGNPGVLHNKVIIIDGETVISGSFNFSSNAVNSNDENVIIIKNKDIATLYLQEWERIKSIAKAPTKVTCS
jgi:phosphatidylserine/phosphatidylglycerophosphate/cardiolipin synthase-like enzyme